MTISFTITNTKVDSERKINDLYNESIRRKKNLACAYGNAIFYNPELINYITAHVAAEIGYQKAIKDLQDCVTQLV